VLLSVFAQVGAANALPDTIQTDAGTVHGTIDVNTQVTRFLGIPYAAAPTGELRWREPQPHAPWDGVREATRYAPVCMQPPHDWPEEPKRSDETQSEDCLYLNVWSPARTAAERLPVMVWIHGGGFQNSSGASPLWEGTHLAQKGVVVVTINYRLNVLGFLVHPELTQESPHHTSGNYGLLDQIAALRWVQRNIARFGGDPARVTIFGYSAGSVSTNILQASPLAHGLFQRVIGQSCSQMYPATGLWRLRTFAQAEDYGKRFQKELGARSLTELRVMPASRLVSASTPEKTPFWPIEGDGYLLPEEVHTIFEKGEQNDVPTMVGFTADEATTLGEGLSWVEPEDAAERDDYAKLYGLLKEPTLQINTDVVQWQMQVWARRQAALRPGGTFLYLLDHAPPAPPPADGLRLGAYHGAEVHYLFANLAGLNWPWTDDDRRMVDVISNYWVNFARYGDPNGPGLPHWPTFTPGQVFRLTSQPGPTAAPRQAAQEYLDAYFTRRILAP
jgi:para-nitrobenzyl esterase